MTVQSVCVPPLYRGDSLPPEVASAGKAHRGSTFANRFATEGLMAKFADLGQSRWAKLPLPVLVAKHIGYVAGTDDAAVSYHSPMLSFTVSRDRAFQFAERKDGKRRHLAECSLDEATHFVWRLEDVLANLVEPGLFEFEYFASSVNISAFRREAEQKVLGGDNSGWTRAVVRGLVQDAVDEDQGRHLAWLIDANAYLAAKSDQIPSENAAIARERAATADEWLLYPRDPMPDGKGVSARFMPNKHLFADSFYRITDQQA